DQRALAAARVEGEGVEPSRHCCSTVFGTAAIAGWLALPSCGGRNRTCNRLLNREPPYHLATPQVSQEGGTRTHALGLPTAADYRLSYLLSPLLLARPSKLGPTESTQRESNPHVHHGRVAGCRYIMGASLPVGPGGLEPPPRWVR